ncbi:MAG: small, acid-soluble spore protein, alpha/beta type [Firmicutes bacterium]|nr:small, acid-soluble spore protein, alpha/beta type [Bacillota bacterium]
MKLEIAAELGLLDKVEELGWAGLPAQEAGLIGGVMSQRLRKKK